MDKKNDNLVLTQLNVGDGEVDNNLMNDVYRRFVDYSIDSDVLGKAILKFGELDYDTDQRIVAVEHIMTLDQDDVESYIDSL